MQLLACYAKFGDGWFIRQSRAWVAEENSGSPFIIYIEPLCCVESTLEGSWLGGGGSAWWQGLYS